MGGSLGAPEEKTGATRSAISRRAVTRGAVWAAPVVVVSTAAPAFATSTGCVVQTNFDNLTPGTMPSVLTFLPSAITASISYSSTGNGGDSTPGDTGKVAQTTTSPRWNYLEVEMLSPLEVGDTVTVKLTFSQPVSNLSFKIHDIDTLQDQWLDQVIVNTAGFGYVRGANVIGTGTSGDPFRNKTNVDNPISSGLGDVQLTWAGPVTAVEFVYRAGITGRSGNQHIGLGNVSFTDCVVTTGPRSAGASQARIASGGYTSGSDFELVDGRDN